MSSGDRREASDKAARASANKTLMIVAGFLKDELVSAASSVGEDRTEQPISGVTPEEVKDLPAYRTFHEIAFELNMKIHVGTTDSRRGGKPTTTIFIDYYETYADSPDAHKFGLIEDTRSLREKNANRTLEMLAGLLRDEHKDRAKRGEVQIIQAIPDLGEDEIRHLPGYRKLHEVCAAADVNKKVEIDPMRWFAFGFSPGIIITLDKPYDESPYASMPKSRARASIISKQYRP